MTLFNGVNGTGQSRTIEHVSELSNFTTLSASVQNGGYFKIVISYSDGSSDTVEITSAQARTIDFSNSTANQKRPVSVSVTVNGETRMQPVDVPATVAVTPTAVSPTVIFWEGPNATGRQVVQNVNFYFMSVSVVNGGSFSYAFAFKDGTQQTFA